eukprot:scaffold8410_cov77-Skeletonema_dohrnii-CCMP3373.AAC.1
METEDDVLSSAAAAPIPAGVTATSWQDAMNGGQEAMTGGQEGISNSVSGSPKEQHKQTSPNKQTSPTNSPKIVRNVSFACDNVDTAADNSKPPASKNMQHNATATNIKNSHVHGDGKGYEEFLSLLASSPAPAPSPSTISMSDEHDPRRVSFACDNVDADANNSDPPSTQTPDQHNTGYASENFHGCKIVTVEMRSMNSADMHYDSPPHDLGEKKEEKEDVDVPTITTATSVDDNDVVESRLRDGKPRRSTCPEMSTYEHGKLDSILRDSSYHDGCTLTAPEEDVGPLLAATKETVGNILPASNHTWRLRSLIRQPSRLTDHLAQSWHPTSITAPLDTDLSVKPNQTERKEIKERPNLKKHASFLRKQRRPSRQSFRLGNALDSAQMGQIQIIDDDKLLLPPPYGLMMTSAEVAEVGVASGCEDDMERCICPRETICATDTLSIILLALARCSAFFDYPLYMMLFLSKAHNLNNHLRRTLFREWIDFGDMHK